MATAVKTSFSFGDFELDAQRRVLLKAGQIVALNPKAVDLLLALVENRGEIVYKNELLDRVWENQFVEENNLTVHVAALRKALGETRGDHRFIVTVPGKGYRFVADTNRDIVIEDHSFERIVVDEYSVSDERPLTEGRPRKTWLWASAAAVVLAGVGVTGFFFAGPAAAPVKSAFQYSTSTFPVTSGIPQRVAISPDGKTIVYARRLKGKDSLWVSDVASKSTTQITEDSYRLHSQIEIAPDGRTVFFTAKDDNHPDWTLMSVSVFGGAVKELSDSAKGGIALSPDGQEIAYFKGKGPGKSLDLYVSDTAANGSERMLLSSTDSRKFSSTRLSYAPTGGVTVALADESPGKCSFASIDTRSGEASPVGGVSCAGVINFTWLADGSGIAVTERSENEIGRSQVAVLEVPSGRRYAVGNNAAFTSYSLSASSQGHLALLSIRNYPGIFVTPSQFSPRSILIGTGRGEGANGVATAPDGKVLYSVIVDKARSIWETQPDGRGARELIAHAPEKEDVQLNITSDNRFIVFESDRSGTPQIWRANRDGTQLTQLTTEGENSAPVLTRDGTSILFMSEREKKWSIWRLGIEGGVPQKLADDCTWPDVSPDGTQLVCATGTAADGADRKLAVYPIAGGSSPLRLFDTAVSAAVYNRPRWSPDGRTIVYKDTAEGLWAQSVDGGKATRMPGFEDVRVFHFNFMADGSILYSGGPQMREIAILEPVK